MSLFFKDDSKVAQNGSFCPKGISYMQMGDFTVEKVVSLDDFKAKSKNFPSLIPAVLRNNTLIFK